MTQIRTLNIQKSTRERETEGEGGRQRGRMKLFMHSRVRKRDRDSQLPPQMTREFHPLSQIQKECRDC